MSIYQRTFMSMRHAVGAFGPPAERARDMPPPKNADLSGLSLKMDRLVDLQLCPKGLALLCGEPGGMATNLLGWIDDFGGNLMVVSDSDIPEEWFRKYAARLDFCIIDADFMGDIEDTVDFCLRLRRAVPELPVILISSEVRGHDFTPERMHACDVTLRAPFTRESLSLGIQAAYQNNGYYRNRHAHN